MKKMVIRNGEVGRTNLKIRTKGCRPKFDLTETALRVKHTEVDQTFSAVLIIFTNNGTNEEKFEFEEVFEFKGTCSVDLDLAALACEKLEDIFGEILAQSATIEVSGLEMTGAHSDDAGLITLESPHISPGTLSLQVEKVLMKRLFA